MLKELFERHCVSPIPVIFHSRPITTEEDVSQKLEDAGLSHMADAVTVKETTKGAFKTNTVTGERWFEFYGRPSPRDVRHEFRHYLDHLGVEYIRKEKRIRYKTVESEDEQELRTTKEGRQK